MNARSTRNSPIGLGVFIVTPGTLGGLPTQPTDDTQTLGLLNGAESVWSLVGAASPALRVGPEGRHRLPLGA
jgi:hypothetical protein